MRTTILKNFLLGGISSLLIACTSLLNAVVIDIGDGQGNTTAPENDFGFANLGTRGAGTAIYLGYYKGEHWVLTANHLSAGNVTFGGTTYNWVPGSQIQLTDTTSGNPADLLLFRIESAPAGLVNLTIADTPIGLGQEIIMVGRGRNRQTNLTQWNGSWGSPPPAVYSGYQTTSTRQMRWGTNTVSQTATQTVIGATTNQVFHTTFNTGTAQGVTGDSGGAAFYQDDDRWILAGLMLAVSTLLNQPDGANTAILQYSHTYIADLSFYREQIMTIIPEPKAIAFIGAFLWFGFGIALHRRYLSNRKD